MKTWVCALALGLLSTGGVGRARGQGAPCIDGWAAGYPCAGIDLLDRLTCPEMGTTATNDIWGWVDPQTGVEWALVGTVSGVAFVSIGPGGELTWRGTLPTHSTQSVWRDIKVYGSTMYVVSEAPGHGMQVFDLNRLRSGVGVQVWTADAWMPSPGNAHNLAVDAETGLLATAGGNVGSGGLLFVKAGERAVHDGIGPVFHAAFARRATFVSRVDVLPMGQEFGQSQRPCHWVLKQHLAALIQPWACSCEPAA
jgi:choice-of-anchor B domain-containing protein